jgi:hypothetical protein
MTTTRIAGGLVASALCLTAACGGGKGAAPAASPFNDEGNRAVSCMTHQTAAPVAVDQPGAKTEDPASVLAYLRYYTTNGNKAYCDSKPASTTDRRWLALYLAGGASRSNIKRALRGG